ncbi:hypothetical protein LguiB_010528 [Lonicera macranthoides]
MEEIEETLLADFAAMIMGGSTRKTFPLSSTDLPDEIVVDILARLPVKSLIRFRCVSKLWYSLISGSPFFTAHLEHTRLRNKRSTSNNNSEDGHILLIPPPDSRDPCQMLCEKTYVEQARVENPYKTRLRGCGSFTILGPCNGTVALLNFDTCRRLVHMHMWNPIIGQFKSIPPLRCYAADKEIEVCLQDILIFGFGYDGSTNDYKIVKFMYKQADSSPSGLVQVYSVRTNRWRNIEDSNVNIVPALVVSSPAAHNGFIHWMARKTTAGKDKNWRETIMTFDVGKELFAEMACPRCWDTTTQELILVSLGVANDSLCAIVKPLSHKNRGEHKRCEIWVMREYGVGDSWTKQYSVVFDRRISKIVGLTVNGKLMCSGMDEESHEQWLVIYDPKTSGCSLVRKFSRIHLCAFFSFTESLVLLDYR